MPIEVLQRAALGEVDVRLVDHDDAPRRVRERVELVEVHADPRGIVG